MKSFFLIALMLVANATIKAQDNETKKYVFGSEVFTLIGSTSSYRNLPDRGPFQLFSGITFIYNKNRMGFRSGVNYNSSQTNSITHPGCMDCLTGEAKNTETKMKLGYQYNLIKTKEWLYAFTDVYYRNGFSKGITSGGITGATNTFTLNSNGVGFYTGIGFKLKIAKQFYLSPEVYYNILNATNTTKESDSLTGAVVKNSTFNSNAQLEARIFAMVKF